MFAVAAAVLVAVGIALLRTGKLRVLAWLIFAIGLGPLALLALAQLTGRFGTEHLWFRSPSFYLAAVILVMVVVWWLRRPAPARLRYGLPAALLVCVAIVAVSARLHGRSAPLAMLLPTLDAPAPELIYVDTAGHKRTLAELQGKVVLLNFWATWCGPCRSEMPMLSKLQREHASEGFVVLYVSLEEPDVLAPFLAANHFDGIQGRLDHAATFYDAGKFYPLSYLISRDGRVAQRWTGRPRENWIAEQVAANL